MAVSTLTGSPPLPDVDECETVVCPGENEQCENTEGSYRCVCAEGYRQEAGICVKEQVPGKQGGRLVLSTDKLRPQAPPHCYPAPREAAPVPVHSQG